MAIDALVPGVNHRGLCAVGWLALAWAMAGGSVGCAQPRDQSADEITADNPAVPDGAALGSNPGAPTPAPSAAGPTPDAGTVTAFDASPGIGAPPSSSDAGSPGRPPSKDTGDPDHPIPSTISCGGSACPGALHATASCSNAMCAYACEAGAVRCYGTPSCERQAWDFEADLDGWASPRDDADPIRQGLVVSNTRSHGGARSLEARLEVDTTLVPSRDGTWINYNLCGALVTWRKEESIDFAGKTILAWVFIAPAAGAPAVEVSCRFFANAGDGKDTIYLTPTQDPMPLVPNV